MTNDRPRLAIWTDVTALGGVGEFNHSMAVAMQARGYDVTAVAPDFDDARRERERALGVAHVEIQYPWRPGRGTTVGSIDQARDVLAALRPDVLLFGDGNAAANLVEKKAAAALEIPMLFSIGIVQPEHCPQRDAWPIFEEIFSAAHSVVCVSRENAHGLAAVYPIGRAKPTIIRYGRPQRFFDPVDPARRAARRSEIGAGADETLFFTAARYDAIKGYKLYLQALDRLRASPGWRRMRFAWAGGGPLEAELRASLGALGIADRVHLLGPRSDIDAWLDAADAFVLPSYAEGMPLSIMEAMAKGLPVIATAVNGIPEQVGPTAILLDDPKQFPRSTVRNLARVIETVANTPAERKAFGAGAKQRAEALFREDRMVNDYARLIGAASRRAPPGQVPRDYVSPNFSQTAPDAAFPNMIAGNTGECEWPYLRREIMHRWMVDRRYPDTGFLSRDEAHILYNAALPFAGKPALEIGCFMGWSTCHLALAGVELDVIDPILDTPDTRASVEGSLTAAGIRDRVNLAGGLSPAMVDTLGGRGRKWSLIFIDGDHDGAAPRRDAQAAARYAADDCLVLFHDLAAPSVAEGLRYFKSQGWNTRIYATMQVMGAAWRGAARPPDHTPDPSIRWWLPLHLADLVETGAFQRLQPLAAPFTMTSIPRQVALHHAVRYVVDNGIEGDVVECGVWRGGSMMLAALTLLDLGVSDRNLLLYDTFAGMTKPDARDVESMTGRPAEQLLAASPRDDQNHYWAMAPLDAVKRNMALTRYPAERVDYIVGDVCETLEHRVPQRIALLRLDTDWYASTRHELERLFDLLGPGGVLIVDDYGHWQGSQRACDEFFSGRIERLHRIPDEEIGRIAVKGAAELPADLLRRLSIT
ncbi:MAG: glycosyltransferase [Alphaproteobacteria bacterium]|nr:glycosyltransferase [Alphaproteobacteria bacterium]